jgi:hypothetical protein
LRARFYPRPNASPNQMESGRIMLRILNERASGPFTGSH